MNKRCDSNNEKIREVKTLVEGLHFILHSCPEGWNKFQMNCYKFFTEKKVWSEARADCLDHQSDLASIHSYEEDKFVFDLADGMRFWLGGQVGWSWSDGTPWDYQNWGQGGPSGGEDCLEVIPGWNGNIGNGKETWNDRPCDLITNEAHGFVCKK